MKRGLISMMLALAASLTMTFVGCEEPEEVVSAVFPEEITATVQAGEEYKFSFTANMSWTLKIPNEAATFFKFIVGESERYTLSGEAGTHTATIGVSNMEEFDTVRVCEIEMTMGGETKVVATLTRGGKERTFVLYTAEFDTTEETFKTDADSKWVYSTTPSDRIDWVWSNEQWMQRVVVESNFEWFLSPEAPAWLNIDHTSGEAGRTELFLRVNREQLPLENDECNIEFGQIYITNSTESNFEAIGSYPTEMEGCKDICEVSLPESLLFNADGEYYLASSDSYTEYANARISSPRDAMLVLLNKGVDGTYTTEGADWMMYTITEEIPEEAGDYGVWERPLEFDVSANTTTAQREGAVAALPVSAVKAGATNYADYVVCTVTQQGIEIIESDEAIVANDDEILAAYNSKFEKLSSGTWSCKGAWSDIEYAYKLTYNSNASGDDLLFNIPFSRYEIYGFDGAYDDTYDAETCWLTINPSEEYKELTNGYIVRSRLGEQVDGYTYTNPLAGPDGENEATILFYDANDEPYALIYFVLDSNYFTPIDRPDGEIVFAEESYASLGATIEEIVKGDSDYSVEDATLGTLQYRLTLNPNCKEVVLTLPDYMMSFAYVGWIVTADSSPRLSVTIDPSAFSASEAGSAEVRGRITVYGNNNFNTLAQIVVVYKLQ